MGEKESNAGFVALHNPMGMLVVAFGFLFLTAVIIAGGFFFKAGLKRDSEERARLKNLHREPKGD